MLGRRPDGYHELESLVAFAGTGDDLMLVPGRELALSVLGPTAAAAGTEADNLVLKAARNLAGLVPGLRWGSFRLRKRLPVAAGLGGGSSDGAAALRLLARLNGLAIDAPDVRGAAQATGADVPVCLVPRPRMMGGAGAALGPALRLPRLFTVLVNPGVSLETAAVFQALGLSSGEAVSRPAHPAIPSGVGPADLIAALHDGSNDLEAPARRLAPVIGDALAALRAEDGCRLARMSGSGATVFGVFADCAASAAAAKRIRRAMPGWWVKATTLG